MAIFNSVKSVYFEALSKRHFNISDALRNPLLMIRKFCYGLWLAMLFTSESLLLRPLWLREPSLLTR